MYWTELKHALLYGQPSIARDAIHPQIVKLAVRDISRLVNSGWIEELDNDVLQRIRITCQTGQCPEIWEEFRGMEHIAILAKKTQRKRKYAAKKSTRQEKI